MVNHLIFSNSNSLKLTMAPFYSHWIRGTLDYNPESVTNENQIEDDNGMIFALETICSLDSQLLRTSAPKTVSS